MIRLLLTRFFLGNVPVHTKQEMEHEMEIASTLQVGFLHSIGLIPEAQKAWTQWG